MDAALFERIRRVLMLGIGGSGMRGLAYLLHKRGIAVSGTDRLYEQLSTDPFFNFFTLVSESDAHPLVSAVDLVIHTDAITASHPLLRAAQHQEISILPYQEALGLFSLGYTTLAVTGTHGKSSTTALLGHLLTHAGLDPTVLIGASVAGWEGRNARLGAGSYFVVEADEYREHFLFLHPAHIIVASIDFDHPDYFSSLDAVHDAYRRFFARLPSDGMVVAPTSVVQQHSSVFPSTVQSVTPDSTLVIPSLPGSHMQSNATLAAVLGERLGISHDDTRNALASFPGLQRRMELLGTFAGLTLFSDYGHHPTEIKATLTALRERWGTQPVVVLFEAHTPERLVTFFDEFVAVLSLADAVILAPVFVPPGRTRESGSDALDRLAQALSAQNVRVTMLGGYDELATVFSDFASQFAVAIAFTAGVLDAHLRRLPHLDSTSF